MTPPWTTPAPRDPEEVSISQEREYIRAAVPRGWVSHFILLTYGSAAVSAAGDSPLFGVCGHRHVCLLAGYWRHPYPMPGPCDKLPTMTHGSIL